MQMQHIHVTAVQAVSAWTNQVLEDHAHTKSTSAHANTIHKAVAAIVVEWTQIGAKHVDHEKPCEGDADDKSVEDPRMKISRVNLHLNLLQSLAAEVVELAMSKALTELHAATTSVQDLQIIDVGLCSGTSSLATKSVDSSLLLVADEQTDPQMLRYHDSDTVALSNIENACEYASAFAHQFVASIAKDAVSKHAFTPEENVERIDPTSCNDGGCAYSFDSTTSITPPRGCQHDTDDITLHTPMKSHNHTDRRPKNKLPPAVSTLSPVVSPPRTANRPPKKREHTSLRPASCNRSDSESTPRLKKLDDCLELNPISRARKAYRPRKQHGQFFAHPRFPNGYDAENDSDTGEANSLTRVRLGPLRDTAGVYPQLSTTSTKSATAAELSKNFRQLKKPADRPDRLGLLNKPKKRSGFCQQCVFEGRPYKISDCLKHQPLK